MKREWDAQGVFRESAVLFPQVWERVMSPPLKFSRYFMSLKGGGRKNNGAGVGGCASRHDGGEAEGGGDDETRKKLAIEKFEFNKEKLSPYLDLETLDAKHYAFATGEQKKGKNPGGNSTANNSATNRGVGANFSLLTKQQQEFLQNQNLLLSHQVNSTSAFSSPESVKRALRQSSASTMSNAEVERALQTIQGNLALAFSPTWWMLRHLHQQRTELQALLTVAMDETDFFHHWLNRGGSLATRSVCAQLPPGLIGQGEKTFRADVTRVVAATLPVTAPMVTAAFAQKSWGRTNLSRLYDSLHIERIHAKVLGRPVVPRVGRSEKSGVMRQLLTELHHAASLVRGSDDENDEDEDEDGEDCRHDDHYPMKKPKEVDILSGQLAEMILSRLGSEAVLTMSHIYMERAWRVAALTGFPRPEELDLLDFG